ncbi:MAG: hypothetical protein K2M59_09925 [Muribaculaceae bacterium]|nr:hypothetical protein [Muribaculaceae bacterium]
MANNAVKEHSRKKPREGEGIVERSGTFPEGRNGLCAIATPHCVPEAAVWSVAEYCYLQGPLAD